MTPEKTMRKRAWLMLAALVAFQVGCSAGKTNTIVADDDQPSRGDGKGKKEPGKGKKDEKPGAAFRLPSDEAGKTLAQVLPPGRGPVRLTNPGRPAAKSFPAPRIAGAEQELLFTPPPPLGLPPAPLKLKRQPTLVTEEPPQARTARVEVPERPMFEAGKPARVASVDLDIPPLWLPIAIPLTDRVPLDDATTAASVAAAIAAQIPPRTTPAPALRLALPDPYENRKPLTIKVPPEETSPVAARPVTPK